MKNDVKYPLYLSWLDEQLKNGKLNKGSYALKKISQSAFEQFKNKVEKDELFEGEMIKITRDKKIDDIFDDLD
jgi:hypothetical protein